MTSRSWCTFINSRHACSFLHSTILFVSHFCFRSIVMFISFFVPFVSWLPRVRSFSRNFVLSFLNLFRSPVSFDRLLVQSFHYFHPSRVFARSLISWFCPLNRFHHFIGSFVRFIILFVRFAISLVRSTISFVFHDSVVRLTILFDHRYRCQVGVIPSFCSFVGSFVP